MAMQTVFTCEQCGYEVEAWDEGNPYIQGPDGKRHHFYHPSDSAAGAVAEILGRKPTAAEVTRMLRNHSGNEPEHICLDCGVIGMMNEQEAKAPCSSCGGTRVTEAYHLAGKPCPSCKAGKFDQGRMGAIS
jgi:hypothetical protein